MSMFLCPLCGKQNSIKLYHPETFEDDVEIFHNVGLGYRKGFEKILGFSLDEFPELREKLGNRSKRVSAFLNPQQVDKAIAELEQQLIQEKTKRIEAEEQLEELDLEILIQKLGRLLGRRPTDLHLAVDEVIVRNNRLSQSNQTFVSVNQNLEATRQRLEQEKMILGSEKNRFQSENISLRDNIQKWAEAYQQLETKNKSQQVALNNTLTLERNRRIRLEEYLEELDLDTLLIKIQNGTGVGFTDLHVGVDELIGMINALENERTYVLNFINDELPEEYKLYDNLDEAVSAMYAYYEDYIEELSDG